MTQNVQDRPPVTVTEEAAAIIGEAVNRNPDAQVVRFSLESTVEGMRHNLTLEPESAPDDIYFEQHGLAMVVSEDQLPMLVGTTIDYRQDGDNSRFIVANPNLNQRQG